MMKIGFIGTGVMGKPMAANLQKAGYCVYFSSHRRPSPSELIGPLGTDLPSVKAVAETADLIILMVPNSPQVEEVLFDKEGLAAGLSPGKLVVDMSSISPIETRKFSAKVATTGADYLDAPVSGGELGAINASLSIMVGGELAAFDRALPVLSAMGKTITHVGASGDGQVAKLANQIVVALTIEAVAEALLFSAKAGADPAKVQQALMGGFAASRILDLHGERMLTQNFEPGFRVALQQKDLDTALDTARSLQVSLPNTASTQQLYNVCAAHNGSHWDHSAILRALEVINDMTLTQGSMSGW